MSFSSTAPSGSTSWQVPFAAEEVVGWLTKRSPRTLDVTVQSGWSNSHINCQPSSSSPQVDAMAPAAISVVPAPAVPMTVPFSGAASVHSGAALFNGACVVKSMNMWHSRSQSVRSKLTNWVMVSLPSARYVKDGSSMWSQLSPVLGALSTIRKSTKRRPLNAGNVTTKAALLMFVMFMLSVKLEAPLLGSWSHRTLLVSPSVTSSVISRLSVAVVGTSLQPEVDPKVWQVRTPSWSSGTRLTSSKPMPSSTNWKRLTPPSPSWGAPSSMVNRVSMSAMQEGPMLRIASRSSVLM